MIAQGFLLSVLESEMLKRMRGSKRQKKKRRPKISYCKRLKNVYSSSDINDYDVIGRNSIHERN